MGAADSEDLYGVLGVSATASATEIRRAYLRLARTHHPDFHHSTDGDVRAANEREMQHINRAWTVLGDPIRRQQYDDRRTAPAAGADQRFRPAPADYTFVPFDDDDTDYASLIDDAVEGTGVPAWMQLLPAALLLAGIALIILGVMVNLSVLLSFGLIAVVFGALGFLASPALAISRSRSHERR